MKSVIIFGGLGTDLPIKPNYPKIMLPLGTKPFIAHNIEFLKKSGIKEILFCLNEGQRTIADYLGDGSVFGVRISYFWAPYLMGTAGSLQNARSYLSKEPFLVVEGSTLLNFDLKSLVEFHQRKSAMATVGVVNYDTELGQKENWIISEDGRMLDIYRAHKSKERRRQVESYGLYLFEPTVLDYIEGSRYFDIKEQLLPLLQKSGHSIWVWKINGACRKLITLNDYVSINWEMLRNAKPDDFQPYRELRSKVWVGENSTISSSAFILGPLIIGPNSHIDNKAVIIGPSVIRDGSYVAPDAEVIASLIMPGSVVSQKARVENSVLAEGTRVPPGTYLNNTVYLDNGSRIGVLSLDSVNSGLTLSIDPTHLLIKRIFTGLYTVMKLAIDKIVSGVGLLIFFPLFLVIGLAIKIESSGPVFFTQIRCGEGGREFKLYKFRSMVENAEHLKLSLRHMNEVDGPMFKIEDDPRFTKVGKVINKTGLDELPQLFNVLRGDMSLVGPRPLPMEEMGLNPRWRDIRLKVKPGITGLWQMYGRINRSFHAWLQADPDYVKNRSLMLDLKIIGKTILLIINLIIKNIASIFIPGK